jgi:predicted dehydrogenase
VQAIVDAIHRANRLLAVDLSYRYTAGMRAPSQEAALGQVGEIQTLELVFHNGYGIDKPWFFSPPALARCSDIMVQGCVAGGPV